MYYLNNCMRSVTFFAEIPGKIQLSEKTNHPISSNIVIWLQIETTLLYVLRCPINDFIIIILTKIHKRDISEKIKWKGNGLRMPPCPHVLLTVIRMLCYYRNVFIIFSLHTEMDENRCTNGIIRVANYTTFVHRFTSISVCNEKIMKTFLII